jgi:hypothetical protein
MKTPTSLEDQKQYVFSNGRIFQETWILYIHSADISV